MVKMTLKKKINIVGIGIIASILLFLLAYTLLAKILILTFLSGSNDLGLLLLVILLELIAFISSILISIWQTDDLPGTVIVKTAFVSFIINLMIIGILSYGTLLILYPEIFQELSILEYGLVYPTVLLYFSIYILGHPIYLFIYSIITYFVLFIIFLEIYHQNYQKELKTYG